MRITQSRIRLIGIILFSLSVVVDASAAPKIWVEQGPGPTLGGQAEGLLNNPVSGAVNAIAVSPRDRDVVYVGTVNGGIWKTTNASAVNPTWIPLTDRRLPALSINSLAISPVHPNTLFAGTGSTSSLSSLGSPGFGVARSTNGGKSWQVLASTTFAGRPINSIVPAAYDGNVVLAATLRVGGGVFRSADKGESFVRVSGASGSGLPAGGVSSLVGSRFDPDAFYAALPAAFGGGSSAGVYRSDDGGVTWSPVNSGLAGLSGSTRILLSVHATTDEEVVYAAVISSGKLSGVFRSPDGTTWTAMGVPSPEIFPGGQGSIHGAIMAHPTDRNVVFIAGDRQALPNPNGCSNFSGNIFRGDASQLPGNPWQSVVCNGAHGTSPHADARALVFDVTGNLLHACDGGLYRLVDPNNVANVRQWVSINGDIRPTEFHSVAYDPLSRIVFGGTQDTGTTIQSAPGEFTWMELIQGDGGNVAVDHDQTAHPGTTIRYTSFQQFGGFNRTIWDAANNRVSGAIGVRLRITSGAGIGQTLFSTFDSPQFYQPFVLNAIDPSRMLIGTTNIYESMDRGDSLANLGSVMFLIGDGIGASPMAYGGRLTGAPAPDVFYVGAGSTIRHRVTLGGPITTLSTYPGGIARSLVINPQNYQQVFVLDSLSRVWGSFDQGASWVNLTANLPTLSNDVRVLEIFGGSSDPRHVVLIAGGAGGVFKMREPGPERTWSVLGKKLPHGFVLDLHYDSTDNLLVAGILGRGAWTLPNAFQDGSADPPDNDETDIALNDDTDASEAKTMRASTTTPSRDVSGFNLGLLAMPPEAVPPF